LDSARLTREPAMGTVRAHASGPAGFTPVLLAALLAAVAGSGCAAPAASAAAAQPVLRWPIPVLRLGGQLSYNARREFVHDGGATLHGSSGTLNLGADTYLWEPWFAQLAGNVSVNSARQTSATRAAATASELRSSSTFVTGDLRLQVLAASSFPLELFYNRSDSRTGSRLSFENELSASRIGFTQRLVRKGSDALIGWDRSTQNGADGQRTRQDNAQLTLTQPVGEQVVRLSAVSTRNSRGADGAEWADNDNLALMHDYQQPDAGLTVNSLAHLSRTASRLGAADSQSGLLQASSQAMWRPEDSDLAAVAGLRLFGLRAGRGGETQVRLRNANLNGGASYDLTPTIRFDGSANVNYNQAGAAGLVALFQTASASYLPQPVARGNLRYGWNAALNASNSSGALASGRQLTLQLGHHGAYLMALGGAQLSIDGAQSLSARASNAKGPGPARHLNHSASVAWSLLDGKGVAVSASVTASDTRQLGSGEFFQMVNLQLNSNLVSGAYGTLSGNLTVQAARQSGSLLVGDGNDPLQQLTRRGDKLVTTVSSGALAYHNERLFGVPRLRLTSGLRLNSQALLPLLGREGDQQTAAWDTQLDYRIGLTTLRLALLVARSPLVTVTRRGQAAQVLPEGQPGAQRTQRGVQFWLARSFGQF